MSRPHHPVLGTGLLLTFLAVGCAAPPPPPPQQHAATAFPSRQEIAAGQPVRVSPNDPVGVHGTFQTIQDRPECHYVRGASSEPPMRLRDARGDEVVPVFSRQPTGCPPAHTDGMPTLQLESAVVTANGTYMSGSAQECFMPNYGGGRCRAVDN